MSKYQLMLSDFYNILVGTIKKLMRNLFDKEKYVLNYENLLLYLRRELKLKNIHRELEFNHSQ